METVLKADENENILVQHGHVCKSCMAEGVQVLWMHGNKIGDEEAHKCPRCGKSGKENWQKTHVPTMPVPTAANTAHGGAFPVITSAQLADTFLLIALAFAAVYWILAAFEQAGRMAGKKA